MPEGMRWERLLAADRLGGEARPSGGDARSEFQRDYDRIVFSSAFRRLHDKTQVFPMPENDHVHSRLTHSLEVSCVGRSLGTLVGGPVLEKHGLRGAMDPRDLGDIVAAACLAHDIGNPPFGHSGEDAIRTWFLDPDRFRCETLTGAEREDLARFEGNAQGFRVLARLQMARERGGMRLTHATLGAFCKYPRESLLREEAGDLRSARKHGFFQSEKEVFASVAGALGLLPRSTKNAWWCRHPLAFLVEAADDICYQILDLEDGFRLGKVRFEDARDLLAAIAPKEDSGRAASGADEKGAIGHLRARSIDVLVRETADFFLREEDGIRRGTFDRALVDSIPSRSRVEEITALVRERCYACDEVVEIEIAGYEVIGALLDRFVAAALHPARAEHRRIREWMPGLFADQGTDYEKTLRITDFLSGMTDSYAVSLFRRLSGISLPR